MTPYYRVTATFNQTLTTRNDVRKIVLEVYASNTAIALEKVIGCLVDMGVKSFEYDLAVSMQLDEPADWNPQPIIETLSPA